MFSFSSYLRISAHLGALLPLVWLFYAVPNHQLGADPVKELIHFLGLGALRLLLLCLLITPLTRMSQSPLLLRLRRPLGLWCFVWASLHIMGWLVFEQALDWALIGEELLSRTYLWLGTIAWALLLLMSITSIPSLVKRMKAKWLQLHGSIYVLILMVCTHYWLSLKSGWLSPLIYLLIALALLSLRHKKLKRWLLSFR